MPVGSMSSALVAPSSLLLWWFGCCSYRKLKVTVEIKRKVCPICQHDLEKLRYIGNSPDILGVFGSSRLSRGRLDILAGVFEALSSLKNESFFLFYEVVFLSSNFPNGDFSLLERARFDVVRRTLYRNDYICTEKSFLCHSSHNLALFLPAEFNELRYPIREFRYVRSFERALLLLLEVGFRQGV